MSAKSLFGILAITLTLAAQLPAQSFLTNGLTAYYPFNGNANDASGNGNNGVVNGATLTTDRFGSANSAYRFNGTSWIQLPDAVLPLEASELTLSAWVLADSGPYTGIQLVMHTTSRRSECGIGTGPAADQFGFAVDLQSSRWQGITDAIITDRWVQLVGIYKQGQYVELWVNGSLIQSNGTPDEPFYTDAHYPVNSAIGIYDFAPGPYNGFNGAIDDVRIYNRALSASEVQQLYQHESTLPQSFVANSPVSHPPLAFFNLRGAVILLILAMVLILVLIAAALIVVLVVSLSCKSSKAALPGVSAPPPDLEQQLRMLAKLKEDGIITAEDFNAKKKALLGL